LREGLPRGGQRAGDVDGAAGVFDDDHRKAAALRVLGRVAHAEVQREAGEEYAPRPRSRR